MLVSVFGLGRVAVCLLLLPLLNYHCLASLESAFCRLRLQALALFRSMVGSSMSARCCNMTTEPDTLRTRIKHSCPLSERRDNLRPSGILHRGFQTAVLFWLSLDGNLEDDEIFSADSSLPLLRPRELSTMTLARLLCASLCRNRSHWRLIAS